MVFGTSALKFCDWEISVSWRMWKCGGWREEGKVVGEMNRNRASSSRALEETGGFLWRTGEEMLDRVCTVRSSALRDRKHFMFEHRTHSTQVFQEGVLGSVVREAGQDHRRQQRFRVQYVKRSERPVPSFFLPPSLGSWAFLTQLKLQKVPCHHPV